MDRTELEFQVEKFDSLLFLVKYQLWLKFSKPKFRNYSVSKCINNIDFNMGLANVKFFTLSTQCNMKYNNSHNQALNMLHIHYEFL